MTAIICERLPTALRMYYTHAAYILHYEMRTMVLKDTKLQKAQPSTVIAKLFKIAVKVMEYKDRVQVRLFNYQSATRRFIESA